MTKIVYCDGSEFGGFPEDAPDKDVAFIDQPEGRVSGCSWYVFIYGRWRPEFCKSEADRHRAEGHAVLHGGWMSDEAFQELVNR